MISGINGFSPMYGYQSAINQVRLAQAMQKYSKVSPVSPITSAAARSEQAADSLNYLNRYSSTMSDLMSASNSLREANSGSALNSMEAASSSTEVLDAVSRYKTTTPASYDVTVNQLAAAQTNLSTAVESSANASSDISMSLTGSKGSVNIAVSALDSSGTQKTNSQILTETAKAVNDAGIGVKAAVVTKDGKSSLQLTSVDTGAANGFNVAGDFAVNGGMNQITQAARDANYTVTEGISTRNFTSSSNKISLGYGKVEATLKKEGSSTVTVGPSADKVVAAMEQYVKSYNSAVNLLSNNVDRGSGTAKQLSKLIGYVPGSDQGLSQMGLSFTKDGAMVLDKEKLTQNLKKEPSLTRNLIGGSSGLAQRSFSTAQSAMSAPSSTLISNDLSDIQYSKMTDPTSFFSSYSRSGAFNMMNYYAVGMMFNAFI